MLKLSPSEMNKVIARWQEDGSKGALTEAVIKKYLEEIRDGSRNRNRK